MSLPLVLLVLLLAAGVVTLFRVLVRQASERIAAQYRRLAEHFGVELTESPPRLLGFVRPEPFVHGIWRGREMSVSVPGKGLQNTRQIETVLKMELRLSGFRLQATAAGLLGRFRQRDSGNMDRWASGDAAFDEAVDLRTNDPTRAKALLTPERREVLATVLKGGKATLYVRDGVLVFTEYGLIADEATRQRFERVAKLLDELGQALERM